MRAFLVHGVRIEVRSELSVDPASELLAGFPEAPAGPTLVEILLRPASSEVRDDPATCPIFFHGTLRARARDGVVVLRDGTSTLTISADGQRIDAEVGRDATAGSTFSEVSLIVALVLALRHHGLFHLHSALVERPGGPAILVAGTSGAGKTTLALALASCGFVPLGDDAAFVTERGGRVHVVGLRRPFHVGERTAAAFPALTPQLGAVAPNGKRPLDAHAAFPPHRTGAASLPDVLLLPEIVDAPRTNVETASSADALGALIECGALVAVDAMPAVADQLALLRAIADGARTFRVRLGEDLLHDPAQCAAKILDLIEASRP